MPHGAACLAVGLLTLAQFICQKYARRRPLVENIHAETTPLGYFGFAERMIDGVRLLAILALGMLLLSFAVGILRCFPDGSPIPFSPATRVAYMALEILLFAALIWRSFRGSRSVMTKMCIRDRYKAKFCWWSIVTDVLHDCLTLCNWVWPMTMSPSK